MKEQERIGLRVWGYLPAFSKRAPLLLPTSVPLPNSEDGWQSVCSGGCGFALAVTGMGELYTLGSAHNLGKLEGPSGDWERTIGKPSEQFERLTFETDTRIIQAAAGRAHYAALTDEGEVYSWGWSVCVPAANSTAANGRGSLRHSSSQVPDDVSGALHLLDNQERVLESVKTVSWEGCWSSVESIEKTSSMENLELGRIKKRKVGGGSTVTGVCSSSRDQLVLGPVFLHLLDQSVKVKLVAAGERHTLALSDTGKVWGWGCGQEGQLGLGSRIDAHSVPHLIPCLEHCGPQSHSGLHSTEGTNFETDGSKSLTVVPGNHIVGIACGGRHSAVFTDAGAVLSFGWGLYGQCGQGSTNDELSPIYVSSLGGLKVVQVAAGLWHTLFLTDTGDVYVSGGNQFGQLGIEGDQAEMLPCLLESMVLEDETINSISCGARHSAVLTGHKKIFTWGWNKYGQLGLGDINNRNTPVEVSTLSGIPRSIACGWWHTQALVYDDIAF